MNTETKHKSGARLQLIMIAAIFLVPMLGAMWMYFSDDAVRPDGSTNHGILLEPILALNDELIDGPLLTVLDERWALIYLYSGRCEEACQAGLYKQRQVRLMLGNDMTRVTRILLHGPEAPDTLFLEQEHAGLIAIQDQAARQLLIDVHPRGMATDGYYLVDPLGNLVMYFPPDIGPRELVDDLEHLLKLSRIG